MNTATAIVLVLVVALVASLAFWYFMDAPAFGGGGQKRVGPILGDPGYVAPAASSAPVAGFSSSSVTEVA